MLEHEVELYRKVAFPFVTLVMTFIAVPFAVTTGRRGAMYGIGVGIVLALVYWTMISVFAAFGAGGLISPAAGGVGPQPAVRRRRGLPAPHRPDLRMAEAQESKSLLRAILGAVSLFASLVVIRLGLVLLVGHADGGGSWRTLIHPIGVLAAGGALLAFGIAMLIWEMSVRYDIRR